MNPWWLLIVGSIFLIGLTKSGFGAGVGLIIVPLTMIACGNIAYLGEPAALGLLLPLLIAGDLIAVVQYRKLFIKRFLAMLGPGTIVGVALGSLLLWWLHNQEHRQLVAALLRIEIGLESIILVSLHWWRQWRGVQQKLMPEPARSTLTGAFAGASSTIAHAAGPIIAMYLLPLRLERRAFVGTTAIYFFLLNTAKLPAYFLSGQFDYVDFRVVAWGLPVVYLGALAGFFIIKRMNDRTFSRIVYVLTFLLGWYVLIDGARLLISYANPG